MKNPNKYGAIEKLSGHRRKPYMVRITTGWTLDEESDTLHRKRAILGYYATRKDAMIALAEYNDNPFDLENNKVTFGMCFEQAKKSFTDGRIRNYMAAYRFLEPIKNKPIREIKANHMQNCIDSCTSSQQGEIKIVCHKVFDWALKNEIVDKNPSLYLKSVNLVKRKEKTVFSKDEIALIEQNRGIWWADLTLMLLYSGMRTKELIQLDMDAIDIEQRTIDIRVAKNSPSVRTIPIHSHVLALFSDYKSKGGNLYGYTHDGLNKALKQAVKHTAHECRHTFTTQCHELGLDLLVTQKLLGHSPGTITEKVYTHIDLEQLKESIDLFHY